MKSALVVYELRRPAGTTLAKWVFPVGQGSFAWDPPLGAEPTGELELWRDGQIYMSSPDGWYGSWAPA